MNIFQISNYCGKNKDDEITLPKVMNQQKLYNKTLRWGFNVYKTRIINRKYFLKTLSCSSTKVVPVLWISGNSKSKKKETKRNKILEKLKRKTVSHASQVTQKLEPWFNGFFKHLLTRYCLQWMKVSAISLSKLKVVKIATNNKYWVIFATRNLWLL